MIMSTEGTCTKLLQAGIDSKILQVVRSMYSGVMLCVKHMDQLSDCFENSIGLFQGEITSPIMFSVHVNDIEPALQRNITAGIDLDQLNIFLVLYADDCILLSETRARLQSHLNALYEYCERWSLMLNIEKTKVMVFRTRGVILVNESWSYNSNVIKIVEQFNYLGFVLSTNGLVKKGINMLAVKARTSMGSLYSSMRGMDIPLDIKLNLCDLMCPQYYAIAQKYGICVMQK